MENKTAELEKMFSELQKEFFRIGEQNKKFRLELDKLSLSLSSEVRETKQYADRVLKEVSKVLNPYSDHTMSMDK